MKSPQSHSRISWVAWSWILALAFSHVSVLGQEVEDDYDKYTTVNQLGMGITNFGVLGNGYERVNGQIQPSAQYKQHTQILREQVEHFSYSGLWVGGKVDGETAAKRAPGDVRRSSNDALGRPRKRVTRPRVICKSRD